MQLPVGLLCWCLAYPLSPLSQVQAPSIGVGGKPSPILSWALNPLVPVHAPIPPHPSRTELSFGANNLSSSGGERSIRRMPLVAKCARVHYDSAFI